MVTDDNPAQTTQNPKSNEPAGLQMFRNMRQVGDQWMDAFLRSISDSDSTASSPTSQVDDKDAQIKRDQDNITLSQKVAKVMEESKEHLEMEDLMPIETWKQMSNGEREFYLDKFYSPRTGYMYAREGRELCAFEERDLFLCDRNMNRFANMFVQHDDWRRRMDGCAEDRHRFKRCVLVMTMALKTQAVFGRDKRYLRVIDDECRDEMP